MRQTIKEAYNFIDLVQYLLGTSKLWLEIVVVWKGSCPEPSAYNQSSLAPLIYVKILKYQQSLNQINSCLFQFSIPVRTPVVRVLKGWDHGERHHVASMVSLIMLAIWFKDFQCSQYNWMPSLTSLLTVIGIQT